jgi:hypothetical protein
MKYPKIKEVVGEINAPYCKYCGTKYTKWRFCLKCGSINHAYTNKNYIGEGEEKPLEAALKKKYGEQL